MEGEGGKEGEREVRRADIDVKHKYYKYYGMCASYETACAIWFGPKPELLCTNEVRCVYFVFLHVGYQLVCVRARLRFA